MTIEEAVAQLFEEAKDRGGPRVQLSSEGEDWRTVPLEWNTAMRVADILQGSARIIDRDGDVIRIHPEQFPTLDRAGGT